VPEKPRQQTARKGKMTRHVGPAKQSLFGEKGTGQPGAPDRSLGVGRYLGGRTHAKAKPQKKRRRGGASKGQGGKKSRRTYADDSKRRGREKKSKGRKAAPKSSIQKPGCDAERGKSEKRGPAGVCPPENATPGSRMGYTKKSLEECRTGEGGRGRGKTNMQAA